MKRLALGVLLTVAITVPLACERPTPAPPATAPAGPTLTAATARTPPPAGTVGPLGDDCYSTAGAVACPPDPTDPSGRKLRAHGGACSLPVCRPCGSAEERTIADAKKEYAMYLRDEKQNKPGSVEDTVYRLGMFFAEVGEDGRVIRGMDDEALSSITPKKGAELYAALRRRKTKSGKQLSVDSHRNILAETKSFLKWCAGKKWVVRNPLDEVEGVGKRRHGKEQLRIDEARRWQAKAIEFADGGEKGAIAAMTCLLMGMRCSEVVSRVVRDLDDEGRLLWIPNSKTIAGRRKLQVPDFLQPYLVGLAKGRESQAALFGEHWRDWPRKWVQRICDAAGVPKVTAHGMRGLHGTLAVDSGITSHAVAAALGHESFKTTAESYAQRDAVASAQQKRVLGC